MKSIRLVEEKQNDKAGYKALAISRDLCASWYKVEYWNASWDYILTKEFYDTERLFNWIESFEKRYSL